MTITIDEEAGFEAGELMDAGRAIDAAAAWRSQPVGSAPRDERRWKSVRVAVCDKLAYVKHVACNPMLLETIVVDQAVLNSLVRVLGADGLAALPGVRAVDIEFEE